ncbi:hypothetical protein GH714_006290 [Hevea brasiliensis]|uniref:C2 domain-containing protein n=1 Tax=Hevea brasiliensis TaxID=3981 RepID=A0A6A6LYS6_HEVBR|nr:hypothetical protein GH714_006290 [Hevea brasiliensis]
MKLKRNIALAVAIFIAHRNVEFLIFFKKLKTRTEKNNSNPEWNDELTLSITDLNVPIKLEVFDKDTFTEDDKMGDAEIDIKPYIEILKMGLQNLPNGCVVKKFRQKLTTALLTRAISFGTMAKSPRTCISD